MKSTRSYHVSIRTQITILRRTVTFSLRILYGQLPTIYWIFLKHKLLHKLAKTALPFNLFTPTHISVTTEQMTTKHRYIAYEQLLDYYTLVWYGVVW